LEAACLTKIGHEPLTAAALTPASVASLTLASSGGAATTTITGAKHETFPVSVLELPFILFGKLFKCLAHVFIGQHTCKASAPVDLLHQINAFLFHLGTA
jgi:hypothetical protein